MGNASVCATCFPVGWNLWVSSRKWDFLTQALPRAELLRRSQEAVSCGWGLSCALQILVASLDSLEIIPKL